MGQRLSRQTGRVRGHGPQPTWKRVFTFYSLGKINEFEKNASNREKKSENLIGPREKIADSFANSMFTQLVNGEEGITVRGEGKPLHACVLVRTSVYVYNT